jgi:hypothetical protein
MEAVSCWHNFPPAIVKQTSDIFQTTASDAAAASAARLGFNQASFCVVQHYHSKLCCWQVRWGHQGTAELVARTEVLLACCP